MEHPELDIELLAVNLTGLDASVPEMALNGDLPILQDTAEVNAWGLWNAQWRDVVILTPTNERFDADPTGPGDVYNLTTYNLSDATNRATLKALLVDAATP